MITAAMTGIREATAADVPRLVAMFETFVASTQYARFVGYSAEHAATFMARLIASPDSTVFVVEGDDGVIGMLGLMAYDNPMNGERMATEVFWWLDPAHRGHGGWLLKRGEKWARSQGAQRIAMMAPADKPRVAEIYEALGYAEVERVYQKDLR